MSGFEKIVPCTPGQAVPVREPKLRNRPAATGRRVGANLPPDLYVAFKAHVARQGITGEQALIRAVAAMLGIA